MRGYKAELIKEIRTSLKNPFDVFFAACILQMLGFPIVIFLAVIVDKYLFSIKYLNILFVLSLFTSVLCAIAIRRLLDHRGVERLDDAEDRGLLSDLPSALHYDSPKILLTTNYLIGLQLGIVIIPYDEIL